MKKLLIVSIAILFFSCETNSDKTAFPTEPQTGVPGPLAKRGGGEIATFGIVFEGGVISVDGGGTWEDQVLRKGAKSIQSPYGEPVELTFSGVSSCFDGDTDPGILMIQRHNKKNPTFARIMFWFDAPGEDPATELLYILTMDGEFDPVKPWPPTVDDPINEITIDTWELKTEGNPKKYKAIPCELDDPSPSPGFIKVTVTRIS
ncbi:MAG: hypothetical protein V3U16_07620 [Candidatus Neomarinimicrobiota bacterium]